MQPTTVTTVTHPPVAAHTPPRLIAVDTYNIYMHAHSNNAYNGACTQELCSTIQAIDCMGDWSATLTLYSL